MKTSVDVYNRIHWDEGYRPEDYTMGYRNLQLIVEIKLCNWVPQSEGGDVPWHRVEYFKDADNYIVWHKTKRIDAIFHTGDNPAYLDETPGLKSFADVIMKPHYRDLDGKWTGRTMYNINHTLDVSSFSIISWNILSHEFDETIDHEARYRQICNVIKNYDIICLQEVTRMFLDILREYEWTAEYWISDSSGGTFDRNMGVITMSKIQCNKLYMLCDTKNSLITEFCIDNYRVGLVNIHLTSDCHGDASKRRQAMLGKIKRLTNDDPNSIWIILGDFNTDTKGLRKSALWLQEYASACTGPTFCPLSNPLAQRAKRQEDRQIDHIFVRPDINWHLLDNEILCLPYSDHYPVTTKLELYDGARSGDTCIVIVPPLKYWPDLVGANWIYHACKHGDFSRLKRWVPHVSLLLGYYEVGGKQFDLNALNKCFTEPFSITFGGEGQTDGFQGRPVLKSSSTELRELEYRIRKLCPTATRHLFNGEYTPHLTTLLPLKCTMTWNVTQLFVDVKDDIYFRHMYRIGQSPAFDADEFLDGLRALFTEIKFQVIGSRLYLDDKTSDLDVISYGLITQDEFYDRVLWVCSNCGYFEHCYVTDSKIKIAKLFNREIGHVDLQYIQCSEIELETCPSTWKVPYDQLELVDRSRVLVLQDNLHYNSILTETQKDVINYVKKWAKRRRIYLNCVGYLSGIVITVMVVYSRAQTAREFFKFYHDFDFSAHVISEKRFKPNRDHPIDRLMYVSSPIHPFNLNVKVNRSAIKWINRELNGYPENADAKVELRDIEKPYTFIDTEALGIEEYGRLIGRIVNIIVQLEKDYSVYTHVIEEGGKMYMFLDRATDISSEVICKKIRAWFRDNDFNIKLKFYKPGTGPASELSPASGSEAGLIYAVSC